jgi:hypothetical protein
MKPRFHAIAIYDYVGCPPPDPRWRKNDPHGYQTDNHYEVDDESGGTPDFFHVSNNNLIGFIEDKAWRGQALSLV